MDILSKIIQIMQKGISYVLSHYSCILFLYIIVWQTFIGKVITSSQHRVPN